MTKNKMNKKAKNAVEEKTTMRDLKYLFSDKEIDQMGRDLAQQWAIKDEAEGRLKSVQTQIKSEIAAIDNHMASLSEKIRSGYEHRPIECKIQKDYKLGSLSVTRTDTGEVIEERPLSAEERQQDFFEDGE